MAANRILIVEADQHSAHRLQKAFESEGYEVLVANSGQEAWDVCRQRLPQAILLDINLPDIDGYELLRRIRGALRTRHVHVTVVTERRERRDKIASLEMGADDFILKPYDIEEVRLRIRNTLKQAEVGRLIDPVTGLPGNRLIQEQLRELLRRQDAWALLRVVIRHLDEFAVVHGFLAGEDVLRTTTRILSEALDEWGGTNDFLGHSGGDEFIIITSAEAAAGLTPDLAHHLEEVGRTHYSLREREQGFVTIRQSDGSQRKAPLLSVNVHAVTTADGPFRDIMQLTSALG
jgi:diguanylate cyclase (GGDEF)-like protein